MMMQPRVYIHVPNKRSQSPDFSEKGSIRSTRSTSRSKSPSSFPIFRSRESSPTRTSSRSSSRKRLVEQELPRDIPQKEHIIPQPIQNVPKFRRDSAKNLLSATAIPIRKKPRGRLCQRLPRGDYVADFSRLMMDDIKHTSTGNLPRSLSSSNFDGLFGHMDELLEDDQMYVGSEGLDVGILSARSVSEESITSIPSPDDFTFSDDNSQHSASSQLLPDRKGRQVAASEDCTDDHPLSPPKDGDDYMKLTPSQLSCTPTPKKSFVQHDSKFRPSFKSSLTASLKALKTAAQSVAPRTLSASHPGNTNDVVTRSFFDIQPALTDDKRPPPSLEDPTPELRRYLNPPPLDSAAQLHFWQDHRHSAMTHPKDATKKRAPKVKKGTASKNVSPATGRTKDLPQVVQLADCLPPSVRTAHASSPPIWLSPDGTPMNKSTANPLLYDPNSKDGRACIGLRHREPRENSDFLRVFVCEMQMRRNGKLSDDISAGRARLWLPPVGDSNARQSAQEMPKLDQPAASTVKKQKKNGRDRLTCLTIEDV